MKDYIVLRVVSRFLIPFIMMYAFYVQMHGEHSPGGGFQAGVILAAAFILYCMIYGLKNSEKVLSKNTLKNIACIGVLIYGGVGVLTMLMGANFLDYSVLSANSVSGQKLGIILVELGVGTTVFSVMLLIFYVFVNRK